MGLHWVGEAYTTWGPQILKSFIKYNLNLIQFIHGKCYDFRWATHEMLSCMTWANPHAELHPKELASFYTSLNFILVPIKYSQTKQEILPESIHSAGIYIANYVTSFNLLIDPIIQLNPEKWKNVTISLNPKV